MKIIFLDLDGPMCTRKQWQTAGGFTMPEDDYGDPFAAEAVENLRTILATIPDVEIVLSSTWRTAGLDVLRQMWAHRQMPGTILDVTPKLEGRARGQEVQKWLEMHDFFPHLIGTPLWEKSQAKPGAIETYCILDDAQDFFLYQADHYVQCSRENGLDFLTMHLVMRVLNRPPAKTSRH